MSLTERIERQKPATPPEPTPLRKVPRWLERAQAKEEGMAREETGYILFDGCGPTGRAA